MKLAFTPSSLRDLSRLPKSVTRRIVTKMEWYADRDDPLSFAKPLHDHRFGTHRFRVGTYRVFVDIHRNHVTVLIVLAVRHRKEAYRL